MYSCPGGWHIEIPCAPGDEGTCQVLLSIPGGVKLHVFEGIVGLIQFS